MLSNRFASDIISSIMNRKVILAIIINIILLISIYSLWSIINRKAEEVD